MKTNHSIEDRERIACQDVKLAQGREEQAIKTFQHKVWMRLQCDFIDIPEQENFNRMDYSVLEGLLIKRLLQMREKLEDLGVAPKVS